MLVRVSNISDVGTTLVTLVKLRFLRLVDLPVLDYRVDERSHEKR
jgi:hypothetical protein